MAPDLESAEHAGYPGLRPRVVGALDEIAAFYGDTEWWVSDSAGLGPELEQRGFVRTAG